MLWSRVDNCDLLSSIYSTSYIFLCFRGYPLPFDPEDPNTSIVTTVAIRPEDRPMEEFERQLQELNQQLQVEPNFNSFGGGGRFISVSSKSMPDIADSNNYNPSYITLRDVYDGGSNIPAMHQSQPMR